jgi:hypothetical protein
MQAKTVRLYEQGASKQRIWKYWVRWLGWAGLGAFSNVCLAAFPGDFNSPQTDFDNSTNEDTTQETVMRFMAFTSGFEWFTNGTFTTSVFAADSSTPVMIQSNTLHDGSPVWLNGVEIQYHTSLSNVFFNSAGHTTGRYLIPTSTLSDAVNTTMRFTYGVSDWQFTVSKPANSHAITVSAITPQIYGSNPMSGIPINFSGTLGANASSTLSISETGGSTLSISGITVTGTNATKFTLSTTSFDIVDGGAAQTVTVTCDGSSSGTFSATLNVAHNGTGSPATYPLSCTISSSGGGPSPIPASVDNPLVLLLTFLGLTMAAVAHFLRKH